MRDHTKLRAFEPADEVAVLAYKVTPRTFQENSSLIEPKVLEAEKVLNGLIRALRTE